MCATHQTSSRPKRWCKNCRSHTSYCRKSKPSNAHYKSFSTSKWCDVCKNKTLNTADCQKISKAKNAEADNQDQDHQFAFVASEGIDNGHDTGSLTTKAWVM
ncbi:hypothetical protein ElyMa_002856200 [Elysia marginata]|uniref:Uncharacterized protein n=1 Tax=Elysia marginata TaxID=1093978 RepID=A0AAV4HXG7_9GAST|nr:hypothetical protein ElyMa_002856200 [Elysia marginata]